MSRLLDVIAERYPSNQMVIYASELPEEFRNEAALDELVEAGWLEKSLSYWDAEDEEWEVEEDSIDGDHFYNHKGDLLPRSLIRVHYMTTEKVSSHPVAAKKLLLRSLHRCSSELVDAVVIYTKQGMDAGPLNEALSILYKEEAVIRG